MPPLQSVVWELLLPFLTESDQNQARLYRGLFDNDPYVYSLTYAEDDALHLVTLEVAFHRGYEAPYNPSLASLHLRFPRRPANLRNTAGPGLDLLGIDTPGVPTFVPVPPPAWVRVGGWAQSKDIGTTFYIEGLHFQQDHRGAGYTVEGVWYRSGSKQSYPLRDFLYTFQEATKLRPTVWSRLNKLDDFDDE